MNWLGRVLSSAGLAMTLAGATAAAAQSPEALRDEAFQAAQWALATSAGNALAQMSARVAAGDGKLAALVRDRQDLIEAWRRTQDQLLDTLGATSEDGRKRSLALRGEMGDLSARIAELDAVIETGFPDYAELTNPRPLAIPAVQKLLRADEALLLFLVSPGHSFVWAVSAEAADWTRVDMGADELDAAVKNLRVMLDPKGQVRAFESVFEDDPGGDGPGFDRTAAHDLYRRFLAPLEGVIADRTHLLTVLDGAFTSLPLSVLVTEEPQGGDADPEALRTTAWLARRSAATTLPAVSSLAALRGIARAEATASDTFRGYGNPKLLGAGGAESGLLVADAFFRGARADVDAVKALDPLPGTERELKSMAAALGVGADAIVLGDDATETAVKRADLSSTRILAFATHGLVSGELAGLAEPALVFTPPDEATEEDDGLLTASEVAALRLSADWVLLSACNTAAGDGTPGGEGLSGLARAFLYAGARAVLVSHWPVRDDAAAALTTGAFRTLAENPGVGRAEALRRAMLAVMADASDPTLAHPSSWAPFVVVGEGGGG